MSDNDETSEMQEGYGSLDRAIAGQIDFSPSNIINEAWERTSGNKGIIWLAIVMYAVVAIAVTVGIKYLLSLVGINSSAQFEFSVMYLGSLYISNLLSYPLLGPVGVGFFMLSFKIATDQPREATDIFNYYSYLSRLFVTFFVMYTIVFAFLFLLPGLYVVNTYHFSLLLTIVGLPILVLPGGYLAVAYSFALPLIVEKNLSPWQALEVSRKTMNHIWFRYFGLTLLMVTLSVVATIMLFVGLIWAIPFMMITYGISYRVIFGFEDAVAVEA